MSRYKVPRARLRIVDPATHPEPDVCLIVAADFLGLDVRTVRARIEDGDLPAYNDGNKYEIRVTDLVEYKRERLSGIPLRSTRNMHPKHEQQQPHQR